MILVFPNFGTFYIFPNSKCLLFKLQLWKVTKVFHVRIAFVGWRVRVWRESTGADEKSTARADAEAMRYLSMLLYPLCVAGALYSLIYEPHKRFVVIL